MPQPLRTKRWISVRLLDVTPSLLPILHCFEKQRQCPAQGARKAERWVERDERFVAGGTCREQFLAAEEAMLPDTKNPIALIHQSGCSGPSTDAPQADSYRAIFLHIRLNHIMLDSHVKPVRR